MATLAWTEWQLSYGLGGRIPWNIQRGKYASVLREIVNLDFGQMACSETIPIFDPMSIFKPLKTKVLFQILRKSVESQ
jgi:hypothetical protein